MKAPEGHFVVPVIPWSENGIFSDDSENELFTHFRISKALQPENGSNWGIFWPGVLKLGARVPSFQKL